MNGEVTQASRIVAAARKSMKDGSAYEFTPLPYEGSVVFNFCDRNKSGRSAGFLSSARRTPQTGTHTSARKA